MSPYLLRSPLNTLTVIERVMKLIPAARWDEALHPVRFTPREVIAHLADWEPIFLERITKGVQVAGYVIQPYDESERAITYKYASQDVPGAMARFHKARLMTIEFAETLSDDQLRKPVTHPDYGDMQVIDIVHMLAGHDAYHIDQLTEYLEEAAVGTW